MTLPDGVQPIPAANKRSPNRQPRYRRAVQRWLREEQWRVYLATYRLHGREVAERAITTPGISQKETDDALYATRARVRSYTSGYPERIGQLTDAKNAYLELLREEHAALQESIEPRLDTLVDSSLGVEAEVLADRKNPALRHDAAKTILKGAGVLTEKHKVDLQVKDFQITVRYADSDSDKGTDGNTPATP